MTEAEQLFIKVSSGIAGAEKSQMFGKPCFKADTKAFVCFFQDCMVFKLPSEERSEALALDGAHLFDPSGKGRAMKEWVQVPYHYHATWKKLAKAAYNFVAG
jgi:hypothetical protein